MITSLHTMIYSDDPPATRAFLRDVLEWPFVEDASSEPGWLIFRSGPSEMGVHPTHCSWEGKEYTYPKHHSLILMCDDIDQTVQELKGKGAAFIGEVEDQGYGWVIKIVVPAAGEMQLYQPNHPLAYKLP
jgi:predicted enzyme related to lactoylglutathione lyase